MSRFQKILKILNPQPAIGGLEISDSYMRFVSIKEKKIDFFSIKLPPNIVENGKIKDRDGLLFLLKNLHSKITYKKNKKIYAIVGISDGSVYTSLINLPAIAAGSTDEAARLNLQMVSPVDFETVYSDWQKIGDKEMAGGNQIEILGAFAPKAVVNEFEKVLEEAGFVIAAIEFPALSLARVLVEQGEDILKGKIYLYLRVGSEGLTYGIVKNGNLYFIHFVAWVSALGENKKIEINSFKDLIVSETKKVLNFHDNHIGGQIEKIFVVAPGFVEEIIKTLSVAFPSIKTSVFKLKQFKELSISWFSALGLALRGLVPRSDDDLITLASVDTDVKFNNYQIISFIRIWRSFAFSVLGFVLLFFVALNFSLSNDLKTLNKQFGSLSLNPNNQKITELSNQAKEFNKKVDLIYTANASRSRWSEIFEEINAKTGPDITIRRIFISSGAPMTLFGEAQSEEKVTALQEEFKKSQLFYDVQLPLSSISPISNGRVNFNISFRVK